MAFLRIPVRARVLVSTSFSAAFSTDRSTTGQHLLLEAGETKEGLAVHCVCVLDRQRSAIRSAVTLCLAYRYFAALVASHQDYTGQVCCRILTQVRRRRGAYVKMRIVLLQEATTTLVYF